MKFVDYFQVTHVKSRNEYEVNHLSGEAKIFLGCHDTYRNNDGSFTTRRG